MRITVIGCGYVGLVTAACFAEMGNNVICVDQDRERIAALSDGRSPIYEPGIEALLAVNLSGRRLAFTTRLDQALERAEVVFIAVGTPSSADGSADISQILSVAASLGQYLMAPAIVVCKSTAPVGTACRVQAILDQHCARRHLNWRASVVSNPEFLKEGVAINDFMRPDRIIIGTEDDHAAEVMCALYAPFVRNHERILLMGRRAAEFSKYAANAFLATKISFMNEMASLSARLGVDIEQVRKGIGSDQRIGHQFIYAGCGYGGSCFPKDIRALLYMAEAEDQQLPLLSAVEARNSTQKQWLFRQISTRLGSNLRDMTVAIWGLSFKPGTDDIRDAPSLVLVKSLLDAGVRVQAFDPVAGTNIANQFAAAVARGQLQLSEDQYQAARFADALVLVTEWKQFRQPDFIRLRELMRRPLLIDGRNQYDPQALQAQGFEYVGVGRPSAEPQQRPALRIA